MITNLRYQMEGESHVSDRAKMYKIAVEEIDSFDLSYLFKYLKSSSTYGAFENREWFVQAQFDRGQARTRRHRIIFFCTARIHIPLED